MTAAATEVRSWFDRVYEHAPGKLSVVYMDNTGRFHGAGGTVNTITDAVDRVTALDKAGAKGIYLRTTTLARPLAPHERGTEADSHALPGLWADVDFGTIGHKPGPGLPLPPDAEAAWHIVTGSHLPPPTLWVHSGGGLYPWWLLDEPFVLDDTTRPAAIKLSTGWQGELKRSAEQLGYEYGAGVGDLARVLRIPGTTNRKDGQERPCRVVQDTGAAYTFQELQAAIQKAPSRPVTPPQPPRIRVDILGIGGPSAFDLLDQHTTFNDILTGAGWTIHQGTHPQSVQQCWTRPGDPDSLCSAHTLTAQPAVLVVHSELAGLPTGGGQKLTRGRLFAHLHHHGDERAAALDLFAAVGGRPCTPAAAALPLPQAAPRSADTTTHEQDAPWAPVIIDEHDPFWNSHPELGHIRTFARARMSNPWAVLGCVLARVVAHTEPWVVLPPVIGGYASLNLFLGLLGPSGGGKGSAELAAGDAFNYTDMFDPLTIAGVGSGEGLAHTYMRYVKGKDGQKDTTEQHTTRALFRASEVDTLGALKGRPGSTLLPKLRDAWSGDSLGFAYADITRRLDLRSHSYRMCLIVGIQPAKAEILLDDTDGGTPQRFIWMPTLDPHIPDTTPEAPPVKVWRTPVFRADPATNKAVMNVCDTATQSIKEAALARHRGQTEALDGHALLARLKTAAAIALLLSKTEIGDEEWDLSGVVMDVSDTTRNSVVAGLKERREANNKALGRAEGTRSVAADEVRDHAAQVRVKRAILRKLNDRWVTRAVFRKMFAGRDRQHFDAAVDSLVLAGLIDVQDIPGQGQPGVQYRLPGGAA